ncbi:HlyD family type I secretion periplasmic adaptor subunit [Lamprobacter modestohalophilus]|uniref:HlyD family type I secretion periplasmic adaptor subunit n=1 Tax=Lamprobacter modestohalophilus TaxID=1064514 RepID=UPI002ADEC03B|nr:HlyD family type I secretion periplasmic adaptor subunit [Lamprobacter modestohalophilus]MEA1050404.1 HlyD family type I secretion periplasmic adaptor subunit [Lamprobacter modestohalophilus]
MTSSNAKDSSAAESSAAAVDADAATDGTMTTNPSQAQAIDKPDVAQVPTAAPAPELASLRTSDVPERLFGLLVLLVAFGGFGVWSAVAPIGSAAVAPGIVTVESSRKTVQHFDGGFVDDILVTEGDQVEEGQLLVQLDDTQVRAQLEIARGKYYSLLAEEARLVAERDGAEQISFPQELTDRLGDPRVAEPTDPLVDPRVKDAVEGQKRLFENRRTALKNEKQVLGKRIEQLREQIRGYESLAENWGQRASLYRQEIGALKQLFEKGFSDNSRLREYERLEAEVLGEKSQHEASLAGSKVKIIETELQIVQLTRDFDTKVAERLQQVQPELADLKERIQALSDTVRRTEIRAPVSGSVVGLTVHTRGGIVEPRQRILGIVPKGEQLIVEARVSPQDIDRVYPGLDAEIRFTAFNQANTPTVPGQVLTVSGDRLTDEATGQPYFLARIRVSEDGMDSLQGQTLLPGMPADVMIKTGSRTFLAYLTKPITDRLATAFREE